MYNIKYARKDSTDEDVMNACKKASIHDDIMRLEQGMRGGSLLALSQANF